jgi:hypothetical protein
LKYFVYGNTSDLPNSWPDHIDHQKPELSICCLAMYINWNLTGEMWSIIPGFYNMKLKIKYILMHTNSFQLQINFPKTKVRPLTWKIVTQ